MTKPAANGPTPQTADADEPATTRKARPAFWQRWGVRLLLCLLILFAVSAYYMVRRGQVAGIVLFPPTGEEGPFKFVVYLPPPDRLETFRQDQSWGRAICRRLGLPEFPDISGIDAAGQKLFHDWLQALRNRPRDHDLYGRLGQLYEAQRFPEYAVQLYHRAIHMAPDDYEWHYALALRLAKDGDGEGAEARFREVAELNPNYAPVWMRLAWRAVERNALDEAVEHVERYIELRPNDPFGYVERAQLDYERGDWDSLEQHLQRARELGPVGRQGHRLLGVLYNHLERKEIARVHRLLAGKQQPGETMDDPVERMVLRMETTRWPELTEFYSLVDSGRCPEAVVMADGLLEQFKGRREYGVIAGRTAGCYRRLGQYEKALAYVERARRVMPAQADPYAERALILVHAGRLDAALEAANEAVQLDPKSDVALYARGFARLQLAGRAWRLPSTLRDEDPMVITRKALSDLEKAVERDPVKPLFLVALASAHGMLGEFEKAEQHLSTALIVLPDDPEVERLLEKARHRESFWPESSP